MPDRLFTCLECGERFTATSPAEFCSTPHRKAFHNRRMKRGAEFYDLYMALRYERKLASMLKLWRILNRLAAEAREKDEEERAGRRSWRRPQAVLEGKPFLTATGRGQV